MTVNDHAAGTEASSLRRTRLRWIGLAVLLLGIGAAGWVHWQGTHSPDVSDDLAMVGYNSAESRQMGMMYGQMGLMVDDLLADLKRPGTQAVLIVGFSGLVAAGCFYFARCPGPDPQAPVAQSARRDPTADERG